MAAGIIASAILRITGDASGAKRALLQTQTGLSKLGGALGNIAQIAAGILLAKLFYAAARAVTTFINSIVSSTAEMQRLALSIQVLLSRELAKAATEAGNLGDAVAHAGDYFQAAAEPAAELMKEIQRFGLLSPYSIQATAQMYKLALAFGWGRDMSMGLTKALLNTSAGLGLTWEQSKRLTFNLLQLQTQGQLMQRDFREMGMVGYDLAAVLQEVARVTETNIKTHLDFNKLLKAGKVSWEDFGNAIMTVAERDFGPAAEKFAYTLSGIKENFGDVANLISNVFLPTADLIGEWAHGALDALLELSESGKLEEAGENLRTWVEDLIFDIDFILKNFKAEGLSGVADALGDLGIIEWNYGKELEIFAEALDDLWAALKKLGGISWDLVVGGLDQLFSLFDDVDTPSMKEATDGIKDTTTEIEKLGIFLTEHGDAISGGIAAMVGAFLLVKSIAFVAGILTAIAGGISLISLVSAGPLLWAIGAITALGMHLGGFKTIDELFDAACIGFRNLMELIFAVATWLVMKLKEVWEKAKLAAMQLVIMLVALMVEWWEGVKGGWENIKQTYRDGVQAIEDWINRLAQSLRDGWNKMIQKIKDFVARVKERFEKFKDDVKMTWEKIKADVAERLGKVSEEIEKKVKKFIEAGKKLIGGLWEGLKTKWRKVKIWFSQKLGQLPGWIKKLLGIKSPSTVFMAIGEHMMLGLQKGMDEGLRSAYKGLSSGINAMANIAGPGLSSRQVNVGHISILVSGVTDPEQVAELVQERLAKSLRMEGMGHMLSV